MPTIDVKTPASIVAAATALIPLVGKLSASDDPNVQAQATTLDAKIDAALTQAGNLAASDVIALLGNSSGALSQLQKFDAQAQAAATAIANDEAKVQNAISFCATAVTFVGAIATGNAIAAVTQLGSMLTALNIH